ncbi:LanB2 [Bugula neritina]|uniref:LanB2 n=1 Tax=Bugula neritina TaxID=10212 RepID=A0A7J7J7M5_BUGNE|nr:LanB2 [Bugula neritina]
MAGPASVTSTRPCMTEPAPVDIVRTAGTSQTGLTARNVVPTTSGEILQTCVQSASVTRSPGVTGPKCDRCEANYYDFGTYGCRPCGCVEAGSFDNTPYCDSVTGQCNCKMNVEGQDCGTCKPGFFNLDLANKYGCIACFCNGKTSQCTSATGYIRAFVDSYFDDNAERWTAVNERLGDNVPVVYNPLTEDLEVSSNASTGVEIYFSAPDGYLGDQKYSYNQFLEFSLRMGDSSSANPTAKDVILEGNGRQVYLPIFAQNNPIPQTELQIYKFRLNEHPFYQWTPTLSALEFQRLLSSLTAIKIRGTYNLQREKPHSVDGPPSVSLANVTDTLIPVIQILVPVSVSTTQWGTTVRSVKKAGTEMLRTAPLMTLDGSVSCLNCPTGYSGDLCDMCEDGFYDLDNLSTSDVNCTQCDCSGNIDSNAVGNCNATGGVCLKCIDNTGGDHCEVCLSGFYGNATAEEKGDCKPCECNSFGTESDKLDVCELETGQCSCLPYVTGRQCDQCEDGYFNLESSTGCEACLCNLIGSLNTTCDLQTGQCDCKTGISGLRCDVCVQDHFGFSNVGCQSCDCLDIGSAHGQCDESGQCVCKDDTRITGLHCDECRENKYNLTAGCPDCPACYNLVQDAVNDIRQSLTNLSDTLKSINDNPDAVDDAEFTAQLKEIEDRVNALYNRSLDLQNSGGPVSDDLQEIDSQILDLKNKALEIQVIVASTQEEYDRIDLDTLDGHISNASAEVADSRNKFAAESSQLYNDILAALGKNGPKSESQNMTALAQQSIEIVAKQKVDAEKIVEVADNSNEISSRAYQLAVEATKSPEDLEMKLSLLQERFNGARNILDRVDEAAKKALDKATMIHTNAIESLYDAERTIVPDIDTSLQLAEAQNILEQAVLQKNQTAALMEKFESLINETQTQIENAEELFNRTYVAQQNTDDLMAEVDVALQRALQAIQDPEDLLAEALEQLKTLQEFDQVVKESKEKAVEALKMIPTIEELLDRADNETSRARETVEGAKQAANEAKQTALDAQLTANEASENAAKILAEAKDAKLDVDAEANKTDIHEIQLNALSEQINQTRPLEEADKLLIDVVLTEAERARQRARDAAAQLMNAKNQVDSIINSLATLPELNTTELDRLEEEMDKIEAEINLENINMQVKELTQFNDMQLHLVNQHWDSLDQLKADVLNLEMIVAAVPKPPLCYKVPVLEKAADGGKRRRRLRKLRKRHRH